MFAEQTVSQPPINPEIPDTKLGILRLFIRLAQEGKMEPEEVIESIDRMQTNRLISDSDAQNLKHELDLALGQTTEQIHDAKLGLIRLFIGLAKNDQMEPEEVLERIQQVTDHNFISAAEQTQLIHELDLALERTPEQIRASKLKLMELFISLYHKGQMDKEEVVARINQVLNKQYILATDATNLLAQLENESA